MQMTFFSITRQLPRGTESDIHEDYQTGLLGTGGGRIRKKTPSCIHSGDAPNCCSSVSPEFLPRPRERRGPIHGWGTMYGTIHKSLFCEAQVWRACVIAGRNQLELKHCSFRIPVLAFLIKLSKAHVISEARFTHICIFTDSYYYYT